jgi:tetrahydromethanopterin S-methyltransferase subunit C
MEERRYNDSNLPGNASDVKDEYFTDRTQTSDSDGEQKTVLDGVPRSRAWSVIGQFFGILSMILAIVYLPLQISYIPFIAIGLGVLAMLCALRSRKNLGYFDNLALSAIVTAVMGIVFGFVNYLTISLMQIF